MREGLGWRCHDEASEYPRGFGNSLVGEEKGVGD